MSEIIHSKDNGLMEKHQEGIKCMIMWILFKTK